MVSYSIIQKSQLEGAYRLDAEYYQPEYLKLINEIKSFSGGTQTLKESAVVVSGPFGSSLKSSAYVSSGIPFLRISDLQNFFLDKTELIYISKKDNDRLKQSQLSPFDLIMSKVGNTIGIVSAVPEEFEVCNISENNIGIKFKNSKVMPEQKIFLLTFLNSRFGFAQIMRRISGNAQPKLNVQDVYDLIYPIPSEAFVKDINNVVIGAKNTLDQANALYSQAENLLLEELGLKNFESENELWSVVNLSEAKKANRIDAEFFQPKYQKLIKLLGENVKPLGKIAKRTARRAGLAPDVQYEYIEISDVNVGNGAISSNLILGKELPANAKIKIVGGELLISKVRPTRGAIAIVPDSWSKNFVASGAFSVFEVPSPTREYLQVVLRSVIGKLQMEKPTTGTSYPTITDQDVENIVIPILPKPTQQKIAELIRESHAARKKAKELLEEAKLKVEEMIESKK